MSRKRVTSLMATFRKYVRAVQRGDLRELFTTVTKNKRFYFLTARGKIIRTRKGYYEFHKRWFKEKGWKMPVKLIHCYEGENFGYTIAIFHYQQRIDRNSFYLLDSYFTLIFNKEKDEWRVIADICTPIRRSIISKTRKASTIK